MVGTVSLTPPHANAKPRNKSYILILESPEQIKLGAFFIYKIYPRSYADLDLSIC